MLSGQWTDLVTCPPRCQCCIRHGRSCYPTRLSCPFRLGSAFWLDAFFHRGSDANSSLLWVRLTVCCCAFWCGSRIGAWTSLLRPLHCQHPEAGRITWVGCSSCMRTILSFMSPARSRKQLIWLAMPCASSMKSKYGCHRTAFGWMLIRPSSFGWAVNCRSNIRPTGPANKC